MPRPPPHPAEDTAGSEATPLWGPEAVHSQAKTGLDRGVQWVDASGLEADFDDWLQALLAEESASLINRFKGLLEKRIANHHNHIVQDLIQAHPSISNTLCSSGLQSGGPLDGQKTLDPLEVLELDLESERLQTCDANSWTRPDSTTPDASHALEKGQTTRTLGAGEDKKKYRTNFMNNLAVDAVQDLSTIGRMLSSYHTDLELVCGLCIFLNIICMAAEVQLTGCLAGGPIGHPDCEGPPSENIIPIFNYLALAFTIFFSLEFVIRFLFLGKQAFRDPWMWFDVVVIGFSIADTTSRLTTEAALFLNPIVIRLARVARMLRVVKVFRSRGVFQTLFVLVKSIIASGRILIWFILILYMTVTCVGLIANQLLYAHLSDDMVDVQNRLEVFEYFGTYTRVIVTMFELTLGNWAPPARLLMQNVHQGWGLWVVAYRCIFCFSLVHVTVACFVTETSRVAADDQVQMMRKLRSDQKLAHTLEELFHEIDASGDGLMSLEELRAACDDKVMKDLLELLDLEVRDVEELYTLMDNGDGFVQKEEFVDGILRLRGEAKCSRQVAMMMLLKTTSLRVEAMSRSMGLPPVKPPRSPTRAFIEQCTPRT